MNKKPFDRAFLSFEEVNQGYSMDQVVLEANRCLQCKDPKCVKGCPINNNIPLMIKCVKEGNFNAAYEVASKTNSFPSICGRICQQELQCEINCIRNNPLIGSEGISIGGIERFVGDFHQMNSLEMQEKREYKDIVGIVGSGPAGLACAKTLNQLHYGVIVFEKSKEYGGILRYGIPNFCLPREVLNKEIKTLSSNGVIFKNNYEVNSIKELKEKFGLKAVFLGIGLDGSRMMGISGEDKEGVLDATTYLKIANDLNSFDIRLFNLVTKAKRVVVVGGGNVAIDVDRCAIRFGASSVDNVYRRSEKEMPARKEEYNNAIGEGVDFNFLINPIEIVGGNRVEGVKCERMKLGEPDSSGRCRPISIPGTEFLIPCDLVVMAIGNVAKNTFKEKNNIMMDKNGLFIVDDNSMESSYKSVYAGGDIVTGPKSVVLAIKTGKKAALAIDEAIKKSSI